MENKMINEEYKKEEPIGNYGTIISKKGKRFEWLDDGDYEEYIVTKYNIMLKDGSLVCEEWFDSYDAELDGRCIIGYKRNQNELDGLSKYYGYPNHESVIIEGYTYRYGAINTKGEYVIPAIYDRLSFDNENSYTAYHNKKLGYVDSENGKQITPIVFAHAEPFEENGMAYVEYQDIDSKKAGYINRKNEYEFNLNYWLNNNAKNISKILDDDIEEDSDLHLGLIEEDEDDMKRYNAPKTLIKKIVPSNNDIED